MPQASRRISINPRSRLNESDVKHAHTASNDVYTLAAVARGMACESTFKARDQALALQKADMEEYIAKKLTANRKEAGFK